MRVLVGVRMEKNRLTSFTCPDRSWVGTGEAGREMVMVKSEEGGRARENDAGNKVWSAAS